MREENEKLHADIYQLTGSQNPGYKINLLMKTKEENNKLREDVLRLRSDLKRREEALTKMKGQAA